MSLSDPAYQTYSCFEGPRRVATGSLLQAALEAKRAEDEGTKTPPLIIDNFTGRTVEVDIRGTDSEIAERLKLAHGTRESPAAQMVTATIGDPSPEASRGRGRPKLGVVAREVTLLPRHWEWLAGQPGGASVALRKLVEQARRTHAETDRARQIQERAYHFITTVAGDLPGFEEAARALFANDLPQFARCMAPWPADLRKHALWLAESHDAA